MNKLTTVAIVLIAIASTGCTRSTNALNINTQKPPQPLPSVPSGNVQASQLDPLATQSANSQPGAAQPLPGVSSTDLGTAETAQDVAATTQVASVTEQSTISSEPLSHEPLAGSWNVPSDNADCRIILAFTKWSGGYRAATRRCQSPEIGSVSAWDIKGNQVVLVDTAGNQVANLYASGNNRYSGQTANGNPISFTRQ